MSGWTGSRVRAASRSSSARSRSPRACARAASRMCTVAAGARALPRSSRRAVSSSPARAGARAGGRAGRARGGAGHRAFERVLGPLQGLLIEAPQDQGPGVLLQREQARVARVAPVRQGEADEVLLPGVALHLEPLREA